LIASGYPIEEIEREWLPGLATRLHGGGSHAIARRLAETRFGPRAHARNDGKTQTEDSICSRRAQLPRLKPVIYESPGITWQHLAASCAILSSMTSSGLTADSWSTAD